MQKILMKVQGIELSESRNKDGVRTPEKDSQSITLWPVRNADDHASRSYMRVELPLSEKINLNDEYMVTVALFSKKENA
jgi:hypothetical protein